MPRRQRQEELPSTMSSNNNNPTNQAAASSHHQSSLTINDWKEIDETCLWLNAELKSPFTENKNKKKNLKSIRIFGFDMDDTLICPKKKGRVFPVSAADWKWLIEEEDEDDENDSASSSSVPTTVSKLRQIFH